MSTASTACRSRRRETAGPAAFFVRTMVRAAGAARQMSATGSRLLRTGGHSETVGGAQDCGLNLSPLTNMLPVQWYALH
jgi:hypothetical protein